MEESQRIVTINQETLGQAGLRHFHRFRKLDLLFGIFEDFDRCRLCPDLYGNFSNFLKYSNLLVLHDASIVYECPDSKTLILASSSTQKCVSVRTD